MAHYVIFFIVVSMASIQLGSCLKCYQCDSLSLAKCAEDGFNDGEYLKDCNDPRAAQFNILYLNSIFPGLSDISLSQTKACHKIVYGKSKNVVRTCLDASTSDVNRACGEISDLSKAIVDESRTLSICTGCTKESCNNARWVSNFSKGVFDESRTLSICTACTTDSCNGAGSIMASLPLALITATVSYLYYKH